MDLGGSQPVRHTCYNDNSRTIASATIRASNHRSLSAIGYRLLAIGYSTKSLFFSCARSRTVLIMGPTANHSEFAPSVYPLEPFVATSGYLPSAARRDS